MYSVACLEWLRGDYSISGTMSKWPMKHDFVLCCMKSKLQKRLRNGQRLPEKLPRLFVRTENSYYSVD